MKGMHILEERKVRSVERKGVSEREREREREFEREREM